MTFLGLSFARGHPLTSGTQEGPQDGKHRTWEVEKPCIGFSGSELPTCHSHLEEGTSGFSADTCFSGKLPAFLLCIF